MTTATLPDSPRPTSCASTARRLQHLRKCNQNARLRHLELAVCARDVVHWGDDPRKGEDGYAEQKRRFDPDDGLVGARHGHQAAGSPNGAARHDTHEPYRQPPRFVHVNLQVLPRHSTVARVA
jgi:hypothetical protein